MHQSSYFLCIYKSKHLSETFTALYAPDFSWLSGMRGCSDFPAWNHMAHLPRAWMVSVGSWRAFLNPDTSVARAEGGAGGQVAAGP